MVKRKYWSSNRVIWPTWESLPQTSRLVVAWFNKNEIQKPLWHCDIEIEIVSWKILELKLQDPSQHTREAMSSYNKSMWFASFPNLMLDQYGGGWKKYRQHFFGSTLGAWIFPVAALIKLIFADSFNLLHTCHCGFIPSSQPFVGGQWRTLAEDPWKSCKNAGTNNLEAIKLFPFCESCMLSSRSPFMAPIRPVTADNPCHPCTCSTGQSSRRILPSFQRDLPWLWSDQNIRTPCEWAWVNDVGIFPADINWT